MDPFTFLPSVVRTCGIIKQTGECTPAFKRKEFTAKLIVKAKIKNEILVSQ